MCTDQQFFLEVKAIKDPVEMLGCLLDNTDYYGHDPYFAEVKALIFNQAEVVFAVANVARNIEKDTQRRRNESHFQIPSEWVRKRRRQGGRRGH